MTCIVAIEDASGVTMGADRASSNYYVTRTHDAPKVFHNGAALIGICGSWRMGQILQYALYVPTHSLGWDIDRWVATDLVRAVRETFEAHGWDRVDSGVARGGHFLLAIGGRCYQIQDDYSWQRNVRGEYAIGSGQDYAMGSLHSTRDFGTDHRVPRALEAAAEHSPTVAGPFDYYTQKATP